MTAAIPVFEEGVRVTTRYFGGYEAVIVRQVHDSYYVVARMGGSAKNLDGGEATDILPRDQISKAFDTAGKEVYCAEFEKGLHPALRGIASAST